jgi:uncharacterized protein
MVPLRFGDHELMAMRAGALHWPARRALLVADLHLEKASWFAKRGQMLPPYDTLATLAALTELVEQLGAREVWCLGDSFHDAEGCDRLPVQAQAMLRSLTGATNWTWIIGNHDPVVADHCGGTVVAEAEPRPELSGHYHPKFRVTVRGRQVARRCFVATTTKLILPAFGALTGGLDADHPAIVRAVGGRAQALVPLDDRLLRFPLAA